MLNRCQDNGRSDARMGGRGTGERGGRGGWRRMLMAPGAGGRALQVSVPQRSIHSEPALPSPRLTTLQLQTASVSSQQPQNTAHASSTAAEGLARLAVVSLSICSKNTGKWACVTCSVRCDNFADNKQPVYLTLSSNNPYISNTDLCITNYSVCR